jgi:anti-sigma regulatory factor (Ser/Thr protein kinase)
MADAFLIIPTLDAVSDCTEFVKAQARATGFAEARAVEIELVVEEVVDNICRYGYGERAGAVELRCERIERIEDSELVLEFIDRGAPFDILSQPPANLTAPLELRPLGGLGLRLIAELADEARYRRDGECNVLGLRFRAACRLGGG